MSLDRSDRCPNCGAPYMSTLAPGEVDNRVCYSCNTTAAAPDLSAPVDEELTIQPLDGGTSGHHQAPRGNVRRQMERQIRSSGVRVGVTSKTNLAAVKKSVSNATMPVARGPGSTASMPAVKPANRTTQAMPAVRTPGSTRINITPAEQIDPNEVQLADGEPEANGVANEIPLEVPRTSSARLQPATRSSARHRSVQTQQKSSPLVLVGVGAAVLVAGAAIYFAMGSSAPQNTDSVAAAPKIQTPAPSTVIVPPPAVAPAPDVAIPAKPQTSETPKSAAPDATDAVRIDKTNKAVAPEETVIAANPAAAPAEEKRDVNKDLFRSKSAANAKLDDEEAMVEAGATKSVKPTAAAKEDAPAANGKKPDALAGMGITGVSNKAKPDEAVPVFDDIRKAKPIIPVTATEPTIVKDDLSKGDQSPEKTFSMSFQDHFPGWRVRDIVLENSQYTSAEHRGKKDVLILNPMNDVLPSRMYATVEIPKDYAGKRPMLVFEVSTKDKASDWFLGVKCMNVDMRPKSIVKCPDEAKWQPVGIDLSALAGKRFDVFIDAFMTPKTNAKKYKDEKAYIRNIQLVWQGKK